MWDRLAEHVDLLAVDLAGFGRSAGTDAAMRPSAQARLLAGAMDANGIDSAFIVGPDVGVPVALWFASEAPERVLGINVFDGPGTWPTEFDPALGAAVKFSAVRWLGTHRPMRGRLMRQNFGAATTAGYHHFEPSPEAIEEYRSICFDPERHRLAFRFLGSYHEELPVLEQRLPSIAAPALITWGAEDRFVLASNAHRLHDLLPNGEITVFDDAGHFSHEDADQRWLDRFLAFVATHRTPDPTSEGANQ